MNDKEREKIRKEYEGGGITQRQLAEKYKLSKGSIFYAIRDRVPTYGELLKSGEYFVDDDGIMQRVDRNSHGGKLTTSQVVEIRRRYKEDNVTQRHLASEYDVTILTINNIIRGRTWKNI